MADVRVYCLDEGKNSYETMTKEQILAAIEQAISTGTFGDFDAGFVTKIVDQNSGVAVSVWIGTEAAFNALETKEDNTLYIYATTFEDDVAKILSDVQVALANITNGTTTVAKATNAEKAKKIDWEILYSNTLGIDIGEITLNKAIADGDLIRVCFGGEYRYFQVTNLASQIPAGWNAFQLSITAVTPNSTNGVNISMNTASFTCTVNSTTANVTNAYSTTIEIGSNGTTTGRFTKITHDEYTLLPTVTEIARLRA